jgi:hypothetical protein
MYKAGVRDGLMLLYFMPTLAPSSFLVRLGLGILHQASASIIVELGMGSSMLFATFPTIGRV